MPPQKSTGELDLAAHRSALEVLTYPAVALPAHEAQDSTAGQTYHQTDVQPVNHRVQQHTEQQ